MIRVLILLSMIVMPVLVPYLVGKLQDILKLNFLDDNPDSFGDHWLNGLMTMLIMALIITVFCMLWALSGKLI
jgi:ABC-type transport system involved in cytochrome c biogenesis permease component